jgi:PAS domain S-box-containing protein
VTTFKDDQGQPVGSVAVAADITQRKQCEEALRRSEQRYRDLVENCDDLVWSLDTAGCLTYVNSAAERIYGRTLAEVIGRPFQDFIVPNYRQDAKALFDKLMAGREARQCELAFLDGSGKTVQVSVNAKAVYDPDGRQVGGPALGQPLGFEQH